MQPNVTVRPYQYSDAPEIYAAVRESVDEIAPWMPWCHAGYELHEAEAWIQATVDGRESATMYDFAIIANTSLNRIEIVVACENRPSQRVAEKLGANRDAVLGKRTMVNGRPADAILYSVLRPD